MDKISVENSMNVGNVKTNHKEKVRTAVIGLGKRGKSLIEQLFLGMENCEIVAVCDLYQDRVDAMVAKVKETTGTDIFGTLDYKEIIAKKTSL